MTTTTTDALRVAPVQPRGQERLTQLTAAAEQAITLYGIERFTTADVARLAGVSIGTVYRYFIDRVAILDHIRPHRHTALAEAKAQVNALTAKIADAPHDAACSSLRKFSGRPARACDCWKSTVDGSALAAHDAEVWDAGRNSLAFDMVQPLTDDGQRPATSNPYRAQALRDGQEAV